MVALSFALAVRWEQLTLYGALAWAVPMLALAWYNPIIATHNFLHHPYFRVAGHQA